MGKGSRGILTAASLVWLASCGAQPAPEPAHPAATDPADEVSTPASESARPASSASVEGAQAKPPRVEMPNVDFDTRNDPVAAWFASKGIKADSSKALRELASLPESTEVECDSIVPVGKPFEQAALCRRHAVEGLSELATSHVLLVPDAGKLRVIWQAPSAAGLLNRSDNSEQRLVQLDVSMQDDGMVLYLDDAPDFPCGTVGARIEAAKRGAEADEKQSLAALGRRAATLCRGRGMYAWRGRSFVRTGPVPASARE